MALVGVELETLVSEPDALTIRPPRELQRFNFFFLQFFCYLFYISYKRSICIIDNGASRRRTRNARFPARHADHSIPKL